jgi:STAS domain
MSPILPNERMAGNEHSAVGHARVEEQEGAIVVRLYGEHDIATNEALQGLLERLVGDTKPVVVSIVDVDFMDCASLGVLAKVDTLASRMHRRRAPSRDEWFRASAAGCDCISRADSPFARSRRGDRTRGQAGT